MSAKRVKPSNTSKPAKSKKSKTNQVSESPLTPLSKTDSYQSVPQIQGNNGNNGNTPPVPKTFGGPVTLKPANDWNLETAIELKLKNNLSYSQIGDYFNLAKDTVYARMVKVKALLNKSQLEQFRDNEPDIVDSVKAVLLSELANEGKLKDATINNIGYVWDKLSMHSNLLAGKATANVEVHITDDMEAHLGDIAASYSAKLVSDAAQSGPDTGDTD